MSTGLLLGRPVSRFLPTATKLRASAATRNGVTGTRNTVSGRSVVANTLLQRIASGEKAAVQECLSRYSGLVWSLARRFLGNVTEAEDAVQDIFVELWKNASKFNPALSSEPTYVTMVTRRRLIDRRRKIVRRPELAQLPDAVVSKQTPGTKQVELVDETAQAAAALLELRPEQQQVLKLAVYHGLTHEEIAQNTGMPLGTVKTHARRGLIRLREVLGVPGSKTEAISSTMQGGL